MCVWNNVLFEMLLLLLCVFSPLSECFSHPTPTVPPLPSFLCLFSPFFFQSPQWKDWRQVWWHTPVTLLTKRKTTPLPKLWGQVTLGPFPPPPQAGHRATAAPLLHPLVLKHSPSSNWCLSGWHPKPRNINHIGALSLAWQDVLWAHLFSSTHHMDDS